MTVGEKSVNPLPDGTSRTKREPEKKDPLRGSFFFLPAFGRCCPSVSAHPASAGAAPRSVLSQQKCCFAPKMFAQSTFKYCKHT